MGGGGKLVLVSACLTVSSLITGGQAHTHTMAGAVATTTPATITSLRRKFAASDCFGEHFVGRC